MQMKADIQDQLQLNQKNQDLNKNSQNNQFQQSLARREPQPVINEKIKRCHDFREGKYGRIPRCYEENSPKEELVLEHLLFDEQREMLLYPKNECGVYKFICTTIRPTKLGYIELYDYDLCAQFISQYIAYEELDPPNEFPVIIPSPSNVLNWQKGDCFDISIVLCSLLIGVGYDAYVVYGIAPREITTKNESFMDTPQRYIKELKKGEDNEKNQAKQIESEYTIWKSDPIISKHDTTKATKEKTEREQLILKASTIDDDEPDYQGPDPYEGQRIHAWVMLLPGKRNIENLLFIEPSTGRIYNQEGNPYTAVDVVFNNKNFWINRNLETPVSELNFNEMNTSTNWEYVMLDSLLFDQGQNGEDMDKEDGEPHQEEKQENVYDEEIMDIAQVLDMPPPWPPKLYIDKDNSLKGSPLGECTMYYLKCKVDIYSDYSQIDGLIKRITLYQDYKRNLVEEIRCYYKHRQDKLLVTRRFPYKFTTIEEYGPGRPPYWKEVMEVDRRKRVIKFYLNRNYDGLIMREEEIGVKTVEYYANRDDRVTYRSIKFDAKKEPNHRDLTYEEHQLNKDVVITEMVQKFDKNPYIPPNEQIAEMVIDLIKQVIIIYYHMNEGEISPKVRIFPRESMLGLAKISDQTEKKFEDPKTQQENQKLFNMEKDCLQQVKQQESLAKADKEQKTKFEENINFARDKNTFDNVMKEILEKSIHDKARDKFKEGGKKKEDDDGSETNKKNDILAPYLEKLGIKDHQQVLPGDIAQKVKNEILSKFKERILARLEIIMKRLDEERKNLEKYELMYQKRSDGVKEDEKNLEETIKKLQFKIEILDQRASRFEIRALQQYEEMDRILNDDPRLANLHQR